MLTNILGPMVRYPPTFSHIYIYMKYISFYQRLSHMKELKAFTVTESDVRKVSAGEIGAAENDY